MTEKKVKIIKAENKLIKKTGYGEISELSIAKSEDIIVNNSVDFKIVALPILSRLKTSIIEAKSSPDKINTFNQDFISAVMELKANGPMFKYDLIGQLASVMLSFLEHIKELDKDAIEIIEAHEKTLTLIVTREIRGDGGQMGKQLLMELESACSRYYRKNPDKFK
jgi:hypothetical protein